MQSVSDAGDQLAQAGGDAKESFQGALTDLANKLRSLADQIKPPDAGSGSPDATATPTEAAGTPEATATAPPADPAATATATPTETAAP